MQDRLRARDAIDSLVVLFDEGAQQATITLRSLASLCSLLVLVLAARARCSRLLPPHYTWAACSYQPLFQWFSYLQ